MRMRRFIICAVGVIWTAGLPLPGSEALAQKSKTKNLFTGMTFEKSDFEADLKPGRLIMNLPYSCTIACGGKLRVTIRTIAGKRLAQGTTRLRKHRKRRGVARLVLPLKISWSQADLAVAHFEYIHRDRQRWTTGLGHLLDGPKLVVLGQDQFITRTPAAVRILVLHRRSGRPFKGAKITATLSGPRTRAQRIRGVTGAKGTLRAVFKVRRTLIGRTATLELEARTQAGRRRLKQKIRVSSKAKVLLITDKPIYQPGQTIHLRTLSLRVPAGGAVANRRVLFEVFDGNKTLVFRRNKRTDRYGIAHTRFRLADQVNQGRYRIRASLHLSGRRSVTTDRTVKVYTYRLPGFRIRTKLDKPYFRPGEAVTGEVYVWYVFGKPVRGGAIEINATLRHGEINRAVQQKGTTNQWGALRFRFQIPKGGASQASGRAVLRMKVREPGGEVRKATAVAPIERYPISITLVPESGSLVPGIPQRLYVTTSLPNGAPVAARVVLRHASAPKGALGAVKTDRHGLGVLKLTPRGALQILATAKDARGRRGRQVVTLEADTTSTPLLVRPERSLYREGQTMRVTIHSGPAVRTAYLDVIRAGQTVSTHEVSLRRGRGQVRIGLGRNDRGLLLLAAYVIPRRGEPIQDTRLVYVQQSDDLQVTVTADKPVYRPGEQATLRFTVKNSAGQPVQAALGVRIVDAAVAVLAKSQPGRHRVFFRLEQDLLLGADSVPAFDDEKLVFGPTRGAGYRWRERATAVLLAAAAPAFRHSLSRNSDAAHLKRLGRLAARQARPVLQKMAWRISRAARGQLRKGWTHCSFPEVSLETLLDDKWLKPKQVADPWGNSIRLELTEGKNRWFTLTVHSIGFDQERTTDDDITVKIRFRVTPPRRPQTHGCSGGGGWGGFGKGGGGGGGGGFGLGGRGFGIGFAKIEKPRRHFPEALYVNPALITDARGRASITLRMADSITTWNVSALASTADGRFGSTLGKVRVFTPFFIDTTAPPTWLLGDRITVPVAVHNHRRQADRVRVTLKPAPWYRLVSGARTRTVSVGPNRVVSVPFVIEARQVGRWPLTVKGHGAGVADATTRQVVVRPGGDRVVFSVARYLERPLAHKFHVPANAIAGSAELAVQVAPGGLAATVDGLDSLVRTPHGCFEQNSSTTYPNVMILQHLRSKHSARKRSARKRSAGKLRQRANELVAKGYQQLVTYETASGGFSLYGQLPADTTLTAYGLHEFLDMSTVHTVDPKLLRRTRKFLARKQRSDGSWSATPSYFFHGAPKPADKDRTTAYIAWALARMQRQKKKKRHKTALTRAQTYLMRRLPEIKSAYTLALVGQFLAVRHPRSKMLRQVIKRLVSQRADRGRQSSWRPGALRTITGSRGQAATVETTALVTELLLRTGRQLALAQRGLRYLAAAKAPQGGWGSTQATVLALQALLTAQRVGGGRNARGTLTVLLNNQPLHRLHLTAQNIALLQRVELGAHLKAGSTHSLRLVFRGKGSPMVQLRGAFHLPYGQARRPASSRSRLRLAVRYTNAPSGKPKRTHVWVTLRNPSKRTATLPMLDLGLPAGFKVGLRELESLVKRRIISRFEVHPAHLYIYLDKLAPGRVLRFRYRLRADHPLRVTAPPSSVYEYYDAQHRSYTPHATLSMGRLP
jgi:A-macroglobulin TED domain/Alpha-2-macroglobulin family/MG2 domain/A-macroglobulin receptor binding domain/Alpha-2-macroglobulin bait region domain